MKNLFPFLFLALSPFFLNAQYQVGVPVYDAIYSGSFYRIEDCAPDEDVNIELDEGLLDFVTGLELIMLIEEINIPEGTLSSTSGELAVNDSLSFSSDTPVHPFYFSSQGNFNFSIIAKGIPQIENEAYPCNLTEFLTQVICQNGYVITPDIFFEDCTVQEGIPVSTHDHSELDISISTFPNPTNSSINIRAENSIIPNSLTLINSLGVQVLNLENVNSDRALVLDVSNLASGIYFLEIRVKDQSLVRKVLID